MSSSDLRSFVQNAQRRAIVDFALANPGMGLADLAKQAGAFDRTLTVGEFMELLGTVQPTQAPRAKVASSRRSSAKPKSVDTRTGQGRQDYDAAVLACLKKSGSWVGANEVRRDVGGTGLQFRAAVNRHIEAGRVKYKGKARATRYRVV